MNLLLKILGKTKLKNYIIFESNPDFSDSSFWLYKYLVENTNVFKSYKCIWFVADYSNKKNLLCDNPITCVDSTGSGLFVKLKRFYYHYFAKAIIVCNRPIHKLREDQLRIYLSHGMPLKIPDEYYKGIGNCDLLTVTGEWFADFFTRYVKKESIQVLGLPRNDVLVNATAKKDNYVVWMPTFRQHKSVKNNRIENLFPLGLPLLKNENDILRIDTFLQNHGIVLMLRPHPAQDLSVLKIDRSENIVIADDSYLNSIGESLYSFLSHSMALITDYSSVYFDYLLLDRPIALTLEDIDEYTTQWPLILKKKKKELPGIHINNIDELEEFILELLSGIDRMKSERESLIEHMGIKKTESCLLITRYLMEKLNI